MSQAAARLGDIQPVHDSPLLVGIDEELAEAEKFDLMRTPFIGIHDTVSDQTIYVSIGTALGLIEAISKVCSVAYYG